MERELTELPRPMLSRELSKCFRMVAWSASPIIGIASNLLHS